MTTLSGGLHDLGLLPPARPSQSGCPVVTVRHLLQKTMAAVTPIKPKKGAEAGHFSSWMSAMAGEDGRKGRDLRPRP